MYTNPGPKGTVVKYGTADDRMFMLLTPPAGGLWYYTVRFRQPQKETGTSGLLPGDLLHQLDLNLLDLQ